ncbi:MAG: hypothetical protein GX589_04855 [Deltaproteobacteria bacterium]|nr:hypothetical protein [Deltaproteobacteria bacterium]
MKTPRLFFSVLAFSVLFGISDANCCDCLPEAAARSAKTSSTLVFSGEVVGKEQLSIPQLGSNYKEYLVKFRVLRYWKGEPTRNLTVRTAIGKDNCGYPFETGKTYLVYAVGGELPAVTSCSRTALLSENQAQEDILRLGAGTRVKLKANQK